MGVLLKDPHPAAPSPIPEKAFYQSTRTCALARRCLHLPGDCAGWSRRHRVSFSYCNWKEPRF